MYLAVLNMPDPFYYAYTIPYFTGHHLFGGTSVILRSDKKSKISLYLLWNTTSSYREIAVYPLLIRVIRIPLFKLNIRYKIKVFIKSGCTAVTLWTTSGGVAQQFERYFQFFFVWVQRSERVTTRTSLKWLRMTKKIQRAMSYSRYDILYWLHCI